MRAPYGKFGALTMSARWDFDLTMVVTTPSTIVGNLRGLSHWSWWTPNILLSRGLRDAATGELATSAATGGSPHG